MVNQLLHVATGNASGVGIDPVDQHLHIHRLPHRQPLGKLRRNHQPGRHLARPHLLPQIGGPGLKRLNLKYVIGHQGRHKIAAGGAVAVVHYPQTEMVDGGVQGQPKNQQLHRRRKQQQKDDLSILQSLLACVLCEFKKFKIQKNRP